MKSQDHLIILFGGPSSERLVSVASAQNISRLLPLARCWFWSVDGRVHEVQREALLNHERAFEQDFIPQPGVSWTSCESAFDACENNPVFIIALHGIGGEDGQVQRWLEKRQLAFTGSGADASQRAFDKIIAKRLVGEKGVATAEGELIKGQLFSEAQQTLQRLQKSFGQVVMKPVADGSSHDLCFINETSASLELAYPILRQSPDTLFLVEPFIQGRELTVGVYDAPEGLRALPVSEVRLNAGRNFDYAGKYLGKGTLEITPAEISDTEREAAQKVALTAHQAMGCRGYSRTDMILTSKGPVFLEINNLPGLTKASFIPQQLTAANISMEDFLIRQILLAKTYSKK